MAFFPFKTKIKSESLKKYVKIYQHQKSDKDPFIIYADLECLTEKTDGCKNNPKNSFNTQIDERIPLGFPMTKLSPFKSIENKHDAIYTAWKCFLNTCKNTQWR